MSGKKGVLKAAGFLIAGAAGAILLKQDFLVFLRFYAVILAIGAACYPALMRLFGGFSDRGWLFSKAIGLALSGWITWLFSSVPAGKFSLITCIAGLIVLFAVCLLIGLKGRRLGTFVGQAGSSVLNSELIFLTFFLLWAYLRGRNPAASGTEKFMDYGFMAAILRGDTMPPKDLWFAGGTINYYYVGQYYASFLTRLSGVTTGQGYNLMMAMLGGFGFALPYSLSSAAMRECIRGRAKKAGEKAEKWIPVIAGTVSGAAVSLCGNLHYPVYKWVVPSVRRLLGLAADSYWFPDATRYIGYHPETHDKTIHEFPLYSYVLSDLHAHVINTVFVLALLGLLFAWMSSRTKRGREENCKDADRAAKRTSGAERKTGEPSEIKGTDGNGSKSRGSSGKWLLREAFHPAILLIGFFIGLFHMTNFWDFPIYFVVAGAVILFSNAVFCRFSRDTVKLTALHAVIVVGAGELTALPFTLNFDTISTEIGLVSARTPLYQLMVLWGLPIAVIAGFLIFLIRGFRDDGMNRKPAGKNKKRKVSGGSKKAAVNPEASPKLSAPFRFLNWLNAPDRFILTLGLCAAGLVLMPEIVYVKDIYTGDYLRANTMFKLTYQAFILFGIAMGYILIKYAAFAETKARKRFAAVCLVLLAATAGYFREAVGAWYGNVFDLSGYRTLEANCYLEERMPEDLAVVRWLNDNVTGTPVVLEANGDSYTDYGRISVNTGLPTVLGWYVHEWLWRGDTSVLNERIDDIRLIYTSDDVQTVEALIEKYDISYIVIGALEYDKFGDVNDTLLRSLGTAVVSEGGTCLIRLER